MSILLPGGKKVHGHELVLSSYSEVFAAMFSSELRESETRQLDLSEVEGAETFVRALYHLPGALGAILDETVAEELFACAATYRVGPLMIACLKEFRKHLPEPGYSTGLMGAWKHYHDPEVMGVALPLLKDALSHAKLGDATLAESGDALCFALEHGENIRAKPLIEKILSFPTAPLGLANAIATGSWRDRIGKTDLLGMCDEVLLSEPLKELPEIRELLKDTLLKIVVDRWRSPADRKKKRKREDCTTGAEDF